MVGPPRRVLRHVPVPIRCRRLQCPSRKSTGPPPFPKWTLKVSPASVRAPTDKDRPGPYSLTGGAEGGMGGPLVDGIGLYWLSMQVAQLCGVDSRRHGQRRRHSRRRCPSCCRPPRGSLTHTCQISSARDTPWSRARSERKPKPRHAVPTPPRHLCPLGSEMGILTRARHARHR